MRYCDTNKNTGGHKEVTSNGWKSKNTRIVQYRYSPNLWSFCFLVKLKNEPKI